MDLQFKEGRCGDAGLQPLFQGCATIPLPACRDQRRQERAEERRSQRRCYTFRREFHGRTIVPAFDTAFGFAPELFRQPQRIADMHTAAFMTGGDLAPSRENATGMLGEVAARFRTADISFLNLENGLSQKGERFRGKPFYHRGAPKHVQALLDAGFACVNIANNHVLDFGDPALFETLDILDANRIGRFGAGATSKRRSAVTSSKGRACVSAFSATRRRCRWVLRQPRRHRA
jgi:hypothetical protein